MVWLYSYIVLYPSEIVTFASLNSAPNVSFEQHCTLAEVLKIHRFTETQGTRLKVNLNIIQIDILIEFSDFFTDVLPFERIIDWRS